MSIASSIDWTTLRRHRTGVVQNMMRDRELDALLLMGPDNIRYATDFRAWLAVEVFDWYLALITRDSESYIYVPFVDEDTDDPDTERPWIRQFVATPSWASSETQPSVWACLIKKKLERFRTKRVGIEGLSPALLTLLKQESSNITFVPVGRELAVSRQVKHVEEIKLLEMSAKLASKGSDSALDLIAPGKTDREILGLATATMFASGAEFITHHLCLHREASDWFAHGTALREGDVTSLRQLLRSRRLRLRHVPDGGGGIAVQSRSRRLPSIDGGIRRRSGSGKAGRQGVGSGCSHQPGSHESRVSTDTVLNGPWSRTPGM